jgi:hypothetical protein
MYGTQSEFTRKRPCVQDNGYNVAEQGSLAGLELAMNNWRPIGWFRDWKQ